MDVKQKIHVSLDKLSALPFVASKSNLFLNCCSYYLVISVKIFLLTMHYIHRGPLGVLAVTEVADAHRAAPRNASSTSSTTRRVPAPERAPRPPSCARGYGRRMWRGNQWRRCRRRRRSYSRAHRQSHGRRGGGKGSRPRPAAGLRRHNAVSTDVTVEAASGPRLGVQARRRREQRDQHAGPRIQGFFIEFLLLLLIRFDYVLI